LHNDEMFMIADLQNSILWSKSW